MTCDYKILMQQKEKPFSNDASIGKKNLTTLLFKRRNRKIFSNVRSFLE